MRFVLCSKGEQYAQYWLMKKDSILDLGNHVIFAHFFQNMRTPAGCEGPNGNPSFIQPSVWKIPCASDRRRIYMCVDELGLAGGTSESINFDG